MLNAQPMRRIPAITSAFGFALAFVAAVLGSLASGSADEPSIGVNRVNLAWAPPEVREAILQEMAVNSVRLVRLSLVPPFADSVDAVRTAARLGMRVVLVVSFNNKDFYPAGAEKRSGRGRTWDVYRLSDIDPERFRDAFRRALRSIDDAGVSLLAIQPGNEINWGGFNGDLVVHAAEDAPTPRSSSDLSFPSRFEHGLDAYVQITRIVREEIARTAHNRGAQVLAAGLSDISAAIADDRGIETVDASDVVALLRARDIDDAVDGYGVHLYPDQSVTADERQRRIGSAVSYCREPVSGKPCWITEWGLANASVACPLDDDRRSRIAGEVRTLFDALIREGRVVGALYYDWDTNLPYSVWRCGSLTPTGRVAIGDPGETGLPLRSGPP
ncbi:MAG TPA: glycoside hydrolase [Mesorhizobium sp.]|nr:glycoside hydrolase [Mesorhizobium sp.]